MPAGEIVLLHHDDSAPGVLLPSPLLHAQLLGVVTLVHLRLRHAGGAVCREHALREVAGLEVDGTLGKYQLLRPLEALGMRRSTDFVDAVAADAADEPVCCLLAVRDAGAARVNVLGGGDPGGRLLLDIAGPIDDDEVVVELVEDLLAPPVVWAFSGAAGRANRPAGYIGIRHADDLQPALALLAGVLLARDAREAARLGRVRSADHAAGPWPLLLVSSHVVVVFQKYKLYSGCKFEFYF